jgi:hypothetical protein
VLTRHGDGTGLIQTMTSVPLEVFCLQSISQMLVRVNNLRPQKRHLGVDAARQLSVSEYG